MKDYHIIINITKVPSSPKSIFRILLTGKPIQQVIYINDIAYKQINHPIYSFNYKINHNTMEIPITSIIGHLKQTVLPTPCNS